MTRETPATRTQASSTRRTFWQRLKAHPLARLGPGLVTGAADDDPSGIGTYSQAGAQFGLNMLWTMPVILPLMAAIQTICAQMGRVTGRGLAANLQACFPPIVLRLVVFSLLLANILNIAADLAAMGEAAELVTGVGRQWMTGLLVIITLLLQILVPYRRYVVFLKWLTVSLLAYAGVLFTVSIPWREVVVRTFWPTLTFDAATATVLVGVFGTTLSPYLFFWQASQEVEDILRDPHAKPLTFAPEQAPGELRRIRWDTWSGMFYSDITAYFIILATAVTLHVSGITSIDTAAQAASALRPLAGRFAFLLFATGIIGVGLLGVPVLAGSAAYAVAETLGWPWSLEKPAHQARGFYGVIAGSVLIAWLIQYSPMAPMRALFWSAVINGLVAVPLMVLVIVLASKHSIMASFPMDKVTMVLAWLATAVMGAAAIRMLLS